MSGKVYEVTNHDYNYSFIASENQLVIQIHRDKHFLNEEAEAKRHLSIHGFWLYNELVQHENKRVWALSPKQLQEICPSFTDHHYKNAKKELKELGYLVQEVVDIGSYMFTDDRAYHFYATPPNEKKHTIPET